jgi:preprotein translocase subunit SecG
MDRFTLICLVSIFMFFILGLTLNYPWKNKSNKKDDEE